MTRAMYKWVTIGLIAVWFSFSVVASAENLFRTDTARFGLGIAIAAGAPLILFAMWFGSSAGFREFLLSLDPRALTIVETWRIVGAAFLVLYYLGMLPGLFAFPAGVGDAAIGVTAPLVAVGLTKFAHRKSFIVWQILGILDLATAVTLGTTDGLIYPSGVGMGAMTVLPLSLIPTFFVPLLLLFHIICIRQARRWRASEPTAYQQDGSGAGVKPALA